MILAIDIIGLIFIGLFAGCVILTFVVAELPMYVFKILIAITAIILIARIMAEIGIFIAEEYAYQKEIYEIKKDEKGS